MYTMTLSRLLRIGRSYFTKEYCDYFAVWVSVNGSIPEMIINPKANFEDKLAYYETAYNEDLTLKANPKIKIVRFHVFENLSAFDGVIGWHPLDVDGLQEDSLKRCDDRMTFSEALEHLKQGEKIKRKKWDGCFEEMGDNGFFSVVEGDGEQYSSYVQLGTEPDEFNFKDLIAEDWEVVE